jgi:hypothetical protein
MAARADMQAALVAWVHAAGSAGVSSGAILAWARTHGYAPTTMRAMAYALAQRGVFAAIPAGAGRTGRPWTLFIFKGMLR